CRGRLRVARGALDAAGPVPAAQSLGVRDAAVAVEAPRRPVAPGGGPDRAPRAALHVAVPGRAAARRAADRPVRDLLDPLPGPPPDPRVRGGFQLLPAAAGMARVWLGRRVAPPAVVGAAPAARLPPADVPGGDRRGDPRADGHAPSLAAARPNGRRGGRRPGEPVT